MMQYSERLRKLPTYLFLKIEQKKKELLNKGMDVIDFGVGPGFTYTREYYFCDEESGRKSN